MLVTRWLITADFATIEHNLLWHCLSGLQSRPSLNCALCMNDWCGFEYFVRFTFQSILCSWRTEKMSPIEKFSRMNVTSMNLSDHLIKLIPALFRIRNQSRAWLIWAVFFQRKYLFCLSEILKIKTGWNPTKFREKESSQVYVRREKQQKMCLLVAVTFDLYILTHLNSTYLYISL